MSNKKIIVCDDQAILRELTASFLDINGWDVLRASTGEECLELAKDQAVETILLDVQLPGLSGFDTLKELKKINPNANVVLMTGYAEQNTDSMAAENGADSVLLKPFDLRSLSQLLRFQGKNNAKKSNRVFVVDDDDLLREMLSNFLRSKGYVVESAKNGRECIEHVEKEDYLAIFMDIRMPELDGVSALEHIRKLGSKTPVILMSGFCDLDSVDEAKAKGALTFLAKPFKPEKTVELLQNNLGATGGTS